MHHFKLTAPAWRRIMVPLLAGVLAAGCRSDKQACCTPAAADAKPAAAMAPAAAPVAAQPAPPAPAPAAAPVAPAPEAKAPAAPQGAIRIDAGASAPYTDSNGNVWAADQGFEGGDTIARADDLAIANTKDPALYRTEHYGMNSFSQKLPNGKYTVKLHFAECYEEISGAGQRVFSFNVAGHEFKEFDIWAKSGGGQRAYVETVNAEVTDGKLEIQFTTEVQSPAINAVEIIPADS